MILPGRNQIGVSIPIKIPYAQIGQAVDHLQGIISNQAMLPLTPKQQGWLVKLENLSWFLGTGPGDRIEHHPAELRHA
jgi:hypothetical protein